MSGFSQKGFDVRVNDIFDEMSEENKRLNEELMFANNCLKVLNEFKSLLNKIYLKFETIIELEDKKELNRLEIELNGVIQHNNSLVIEENVVEFDSNEENNQQIYQLVKEEIVSDYEVIVGNDYQINDNTEVDESQDLSKTTQTINQNHLISSETSLTQNHNQITVNESTEDMDTDFGVIDGNDTQLIDNSSKERVSRVMFEIIKTENQSEEELGSVQETDEIIDLDDNIDEEINEPINEQNIGLIESMTGIESHQSFKEEFTSDIEVFDGNDYQFIDNSDDELTEMFKMTEILGENNLRTLKTTSEILTGNFQINNKNTENQSPEDMVRDYASNEGNDTQMSAQLENNINNNNNNNKSKKKRFFCSYDGCHIRRNKGFKSNRSLKRHVRRVHLLSFDCEECHRCFKTVRALRTHKSEQLGLQYECYICKHEFKSECDLISHLKSRHELKRNLIKCDYWDCRQMFVTSNDLEEHKNKEHSLLLQCDQCDEGFVLHSELRDHKKECHFNVNPTLFQPLNENTIPLVSPLKSEQTIEENTIKCDYKDCHKIFDNSSDLEEHKKEVHSLLFECDECDKRFCDDLGLRTHKSAHHSIEYKCSLCNLEFRGKCFLNSHMKSRHKPNRDLIKCQYKNCLQLFTDYHYLDKHIKRVHSSVKHNSSKPLDSALNSKPKTEETTVKCDYKDCQQIFDNLIDLSSHKERIHSTVRLLRNRSIYRQNMDRQPNRRYHQKNIKMYLRSRKRQFVSPEPSVEKQTNSGQNNSNCNKTKESNSLVPKFKCYLKGCAKSFSERSRLRQHMAGHSLGKESLVWENVWKYRCHWKGCNERFSDKIELKYHLNIHKNIIKLFECRFGGCSQSYFDLASLRSHIKHIHEK